MKDDGTEAIDPLTEWSVAAAETRLISSHLLTFAVTKDSRSVSHTSLYTVGSTEVTKT